MSKNWEKQQAKILGQRKANNMWKDVGKHISEGISKICKEAVHQRDNGGLLEEEVRATANGMAVATFIIYCREDSRVWGESEAWNKEVGMQEDGGDLPNLALWHMEGVGVEERQRGPQGGSSKGLDVVEMEATEDMLQVENLLNECGQAHNACRIGDYDKQLEMKESSEILDVFLSEEESEIFNVEIRRLKKCSFICKLLGGRPSRGMVRDMLHVALMDRVPQIKNVDNMGQNFFHIEVAEGSNLSQILDMKFVELKYGRALLLEWHPNFNVMEEAKKLGNPMVISMVFPNLPRQLYPLMPKIGAKIGRVCPLKATMADKVLSMLTSGLLFWDVTMDCNKKETQLHLI